MINSLFLALYLTVPLFIYDYIYIVLIGGDDLTFVFRYWYLSFFYFSFWIQFPLIGRAMKKAADKATTHANPYHAAERSPRSTLQADPTARILIAGQAPVRKAHETGIP